MIQPHGHELALDELSKEYKTEDELVDPELVVPQDDGGWERNSFEFERNGLEAHQHFLTCTVLP